MPDLLQFSGTGGLASLYGGEGSYGGGWGGLIAGLGSAAGSVISSLTQRSQGDLAQYGDPWGPNVLYTQEARLESALGAALQGGCGSPFVAGGSQLRPATFSMVNPASGKATWFKPAGRPILWSADYSAARRVKRIGTKARRVCGTRGGR